MDKFPIYIGTRGIAAYKEEGRNITIENIVYYHKYITIENITFCSRWISMDGIRMIFLINGACETKMTNIKHVQCSVTIMETNNWLIESTKINTCYHPPFSAADKECVRLSC
jgi:hypothetical protein